MEPVVPIAVQVEMLSESAEIRERELQLQINGTLQRIEALHQQRRNSERPQVREQSRQVPDAQSAQTLPEHFRRAATFDVTDVIITLLLGPPLTYLIFGSFVRLPVVIAVVFACFYLLGAVCRALLLTEPE